MGTSLHRVYWIVPDVVRVPVVFEAVERNKFGRYVTTNRNELVSYRQRN